MSHYLEMSGVPLEFINSPDEIKMTQQQQAEVQAASQQAALEADVMSANAKEMGKAQAKVAEEDAKAR